MMYLFASYTPPSRYCAVHALVWFIITVCSAQRARIRSESKQMSLYSSPEEEAILLLRLKVSLGQDILSREFFERVTNGLLYSYQEGKNRQLGINKLLAHRRLKHKSRSQRNRLVQKDVVKQPTNRLWSSAFRRPGNARLKKTSDSIQITSLDRIKYEEALVRFYVVFNGQIVNGVHASKTFNLLTTEELSAYTTYPVLHRVEAVVQEVEPVPAASIWSWWMVLGIVVIAIAVLIAAVFAVLQFCLKHKVKNENFSKLGLDPVNHTLSVKPGIFERIPTTQTTSPLLTVQTQQSAALNKPQPHNKEFQTSYPFELPTSRKKMHRCGLSCKMDLEEPDKNRQNNPWCSWEMSDREETPLTLNARNRFTDAAGVKWVTVNEPNVRHHPRPYPGPGFDYKHHSPPISNERELESQIRESIWNKNVQKKSPFDWKNSPSAPLSVSSTTVSVGLKDRFDALRYRILKTKMDNKSGLRNVKKTNHGHKIHKSHGKINRQNRSDTMPEIFDLLSFGKNLRSSALPSEDGSNRFSIASNISDSTAESIHHFNNPPIFTQDSKRLFENPNKASHNSKLVNSQSTKPLKYNSEAQLFARNHTDGYCDENFIPSHLTQNSIGPVKNKGLKGFADPKTGQICHRENASHKRRSIAGIQSERKPFHQGESGDVVMPSANAGKIYTLPRETNSNSINKKGKQSRLHLHERNNGNASNLSRNYFSKSNDTQSSQRNAVHSKLNRQPVAEYLSNHSRVYPQQLSSSINAGQSINDNYLPPFSSSTMDESIEGFRHFLRLNGIWDASIKSLFEAGFVNRQLLPLLQTQEGQAMVRDLNIPSAQRLLIISLARKTIAEFSLELGD